ncbi:MAG: hypothetical protein ABI604_16305 [Nitrospirota bacterium]
MIRSARSRNTVLVAGLVALVYASLAAMAASCAFSHIDASNGHAHHGSNETGPHSALCAWACQATSDAGLVTEPSALSMSPVIQLVVSSSHQAISSSSSSLLHSRAPPSVRFVLIG